MKKPLACLLLMALSEHLGLIKPQMCTSDQDPVTSFMRPSPFPQDDESDLPETDVVIDPLSDGTISKLLQAALRQTS